MLTCALCTGEIAQSTHFCDTCGAPGPAATAEERISWRAQRAPVASGAPASGSAAPQWAPSAPLPPPASSPAPPPPPASMPSPFSWAPPSSGASTPASPWDQPQPGPTAPPPSSANPFPDWRLPTVPGEPGRVGNIAAKFVVLAAAAGLAIGSFLPWASVDLAFLGHHTISGIDGGDGWFSLIAGIIVAVLALTNLEPIKAKVRNAYYGIGVGAVLFTLFEFGDAAEVFDEASEVSEGLVDPQFGFGLFLLLISAVVLMVGAAKLKTEN